MKHAFRFLCLAVVMSLLAACGGGSSAGDDPTTTAPEARATTTTVADTSTTGGSDSEGDDNGPIVPVCAGTEAMNEALEGYDDALSGEEMDFDEAISQMRAAVEAAPGEIRDDFEIVVDEVERVLTVLKEIDLEPGAIPTEEQVEQLMALGEGMESEEFTAAAERLEAWFEDNCS